MNEKELIEKWKIHDILPYPKSRIELVDRILQINLQRKAIVKQSFKAGLINGALDKCEIDTKEINKMLKEQFKAGQESRDLKCGSCKVGGNIDGFVNLCIMCSDRLDEELKQKAEQDTARDLIQIIRQELYCASGDLNHLANDKKLEKLLEELKSNWGDKLE